MQYLVIWSCNVAWEMCVLECSGIYIYIYIFIDIYTKARLYTQLCFAKKVWYFSYDSMKTRNNCCWMKASEVVHEWEDSLGQSID